VSLKILVVEDENEIQRLIKVYLSDYGRCDTASDGEEAISKFKSSLEAGEKFDLIVLDILMPKMNGCEVLERIRELEKARGIIGLDGVKIIMLTALDDTKNVIWSFKHRCDAYLVKPFTSEDLVKEIKDLGLL